MKKMMWLVFIVGCILLFTQCSEDEPVTPTPPKVEKPVITGQPTSLEVALGETATLKVTATGMTLMYQWYKNGTPVIGATNETLNIPIVQLSDMGEFSCTVSSEGGSIASEKATVGVKESFSWDTKKIIPDNDINWRERITSSPAETEIEFYKTENEWFTIHYIGNISSTGIKSNAKLLIPSSGGSEEEIALTLEIVEVYENKLHIKFNEGNTMGNCIIFPNK